jgi:hypothetical protein
MTPEEVRKSTVDHISRVEWFLCCIARIIEHRSKLHDASKLESPEIEMFERVTGKLNGMTYGSDEYEKQRKEMLGSALKHHYANNRHHPEFFPNGVDDMNLVDIVEMMSDWIAASERHADGCPYQSLEVNEKRFGLSPQLKSILKNTIDLLMENHLVKSKQAMGAGK